jgi:hypothetical protein
VLRLEESLQAHIPEVDKMAEMLKYQGFDDTGDVASRMTHLEGFGLRPSEVPGYYQGVDYDTVSQQSS